MTRFNALHRRTLLLASKITPEVMMEVMKTESQPPARAVGFSPLYVTR